MKKSISNFWFYLCLMIIMSIWMSIKKIVDNDIWWHIKTGEYIANNKLIPSTDVFSFFGINHHFEWIAHEWLSDLILYKIQYYFGFSGLMLFPAIMLFMVMIILIKFRTFIKEEQKMGFILWVFISGFILSMFSSTRPHMFSFILFILSVYAIQSFLRGKIKSIYYIPCIMIFWVNLHGGSSSLIFVLLFILLISTSFNINFQNIENKKMNIHLRKHILFSLFLTILSGLCNPYGYKMLLYPIHNMLDNTMMQAIEEWQSPNFHTTNGLIIFFVISVVFLLLITQKRKINLYELLVIFAFLFLSLRSIRQISYFVIAVTPIVLVYLPYLKVKWDKHKLYLVMLVSLTFILSISVVQDVKSPLNESTYPKAAIEHIKKSDIQYLFNDYDWGGYLIYHNIHPFIDGRADIFSKHTLKPYLEIVTLQDGWQSKFNSYNFDSALLRKKSKLSEELKNNLHWKVYYEDENTILLTKP